jgi:tRNA U34 2-thiouridine synthase MnmA/TrmU
MSTGLDSLLAAKLIKDQGVEVLGITFFYRFDGLAKQHTHGDIQKWGEPLGIPIQSIDISDEFLSTLLNPPHGYGTNFNPCIDCHLFMFTKAYAMLDEMNAQFLVTGEVVGQRPMSQNSQVLAHMNKIMKFSDILVRPLSAKLLPETLPEREGWIDRNLLLDISGRGRKRQFELAQKLGVSRFPNPGGGCILTNPQFGRRAKKLVTTKGRESVEVEDFELLRMGRHLWPTDELHLIVGRNQEENDQLFSFQKDRMRFEAMDITGPVLLAEGVQTYEEIALAAAVTLRYCGQKAQGEQRVRYESSTQSGVILAKAFQVEKCEKWLI